MIDVSGLDEPDLIMVNLLVRFQLAAHRLGASILLRHPGPQLVDLLGFLGLSDVLPVAAESGCEMERLTEQREEVLVDEEVDPGDPAP